MKPPTIGELRHVAVFKRLVTAEHASGEQKPTGYTTLGTMRAKYEQDYLRDAEIAHADQVQGKTVVKLTTRHLAGLTTADEVTVDGVDYKIRSIENVENRDVWMICRIVVMDKAN